MQVLQWAVPRGVEKAAPRPFVVKEVEDWVDKGFDLCVTGTSLQVADVKMKCLIHVQHTRKRHASCRCSMYKNGIPCEFHIMSAGCCAL